MPRETLPTGASLLALARGSVARVSPSTRPPLTEPSEPVARQRIAPTRLGSPRPHGEEIAEERPSALAPVATRKQKVNARISAALLDEVRDCVVALSGPPHGLTMDEFAEEAYRRELERLKRSHHAGQAFARRAYNPKPGRRIA